MCVEQGTIWTPRKNSQGLWRCHLRLLNSCTDTLGIKWSRARSICFSRYVREGRIAERPHVKADNGIRDCLNEILNENWLLTLTQLNKRLWQCLSQIPEICGRTVAEELRTNAVSYKTSQACSCARKKPSWCHSEATGLYHPVHGPCCVGPHCFHRRMWLQYLDCKKSLKSKRRGTGLKKCAWAARKKCYCHNGHFTQQCSGFLLCSYWWDECAKIWWLLSTNKT